VRTGVQEYPMGGLGADHYNTRTSTSKRGRWDRLRVFSSMVVVVVLHVVDVVLWEWDVVVVLSWGGTSPDHSDHAGR
jgi:hypothetical protein